MNSKGGINPAFLIALVAVLVGIIVFVLSIWKRDVPPQGSFSLKDDEVSAETTGKFDEFSKNRLYRLQVPLTFFDGERDWTAPPGTLVDFASIPNWAIPFTGRPDEPEIYRASIVHDAYCQKSSECENYRTRSWQATHKMFYEACVVSGANPSTAALWAAAVRIGGSKWDENGNTIPNSLSIFGYGVLQLLREWTQSQQPPESYEQVDQKIDQWEAIAQLEADALTLIRRGELDHAEESLQSVAALLDSEFRTNPDASLLLSFKGHLHKNYAALHDQREEFQLATESLEEAQNAFEAILERHSDPSAMSGLGVVGLLRADLAVKKQQPEDGRRQLETARRLMDEVRRIAPGREFDTFDLEFASELKKSIDKRIPDR